MKKLLRIFLYLILASGALGFGYAFVTHLPKSRAPLSADDPTNPTIATNLAVTTNPATALNTNMAQTPAVSPTPSSHWGTYLGGFLLATICLGILASYDFAHYFVHRAGQLVFDEDLVVESDPEYEEAEKVWVNGQHLEAIQLMRDFLAKNPHAQYAALRIAEIYEKNLGNYLAAALEYEEILKKRLPPERWGWAAIHLANLYSGKLNKLPQAETLLRRIISEYPQTAAAKKARERLGEPEPVIQSEAEIVASEPAVAEDSQPPASNLPRGFRPKA